MLFPAAFCAIAVGALTGGYLFAAEAGTQPITFDKPLIARWAFDEQSGIDCLDSSGNNNDAIPLQPAGESLRLRYRLIVHDGPARVEQLNRLSRQFRLHGKVAGAAPDTVRIEPGFVRLKDKE